MQLFRITATDYGNGVHGLQVLGSENIIGAGGLGRNLIGHSGENGIVIGKDSGSAADANEIVSNWIGTNDIGDDLGMEIGIQILNGANSLVTNNKISNNTNGSAYQGESGVFLHGNTISDNQTAGAYFPAPGQLGSLDSSQPNIIGNNTFGVLVDAYESANPTGLAIIRNNFIGTWSPGTATGNVNAHNNTGIQFNPTDDSSYGNTIRGNRIHANGSTSTPGINLGMTELDYGGDGTGPNTLLNYPDFDPNATSFDQATGQLSYRYRVQTTPINADWPLTIDFYLTSDSSPQGLTYIGSETYPESAAFEFRSGTLSTSESVSGSTHLVATATDSSGNTSQFTHQPFPLVVSDVLFSDRFEGP